MASEQSVAELEAADEFVGRHVGPDADEQARMLAALDLPSIEELIDQAVPDSIRTRETLRVPPARSETDAVTRLRDLAQRNDVFTSLIGMGYSDTVTPPVILRNVLEDPAWYTAYTPYQPEISQGRLEALLNFQTMVSDLTGMEIANASLLDEATAAGEAMAMFRRLNPNAGETFVVDADCHPQTIDVVRTRAEPIGIDVVVVEPGAGIGEAGVFGALLQYPGSSGAGRDLRPVMAGLYATYHGPDGLRRIATRVHRLTSILADGLESGGLEVVTRSFFDTITVHVPDRAAQVAARARRQRINIRVVDADTIGIALDETTTRGVVEQVWDAFSVHASVAGLDRRALRIIPDELTRTSEFLMHPVFHRYRSETKMLRYLRRLADRDLALDRTMIPLGSCTMKLNATSEMVPVTWAEFARLHPFVPLDQAQGYLQLFAELESWLCDITGYDAVSLQPNAGSQGELAGLLAIRKYHQSRREGERDVCLIPASAHGTNAASAAMAGLRVVVVECDEDGNVDFDDLKAKAHDHAERLAALMVTYPSTHGVSEDRIVDICAVVHEFGGQVYLDGANLNALVGVAKPGEFGADVSHLNLHKTFCIPHGGGGPGARPIGLRGHPAPVPPPPRQAARAGPGDGPRGISAGARGGAPRPPLSRARLAAVGGPGLPRAS